MNFFKFMIVGHGCYQTTVAHDLHLATYVPTIGLIYEGQDFPLNILLFQENEVKVALVFDLFPVYKYV